MGRGKGNNSANHPNDGASENEHHNEADENTNSSLHHNSHSNNINPDTKEVSVFDLPKWYEVLLIEKYAHTLQPVLHKLKPTLVLLKCIRINIHDIGEMVCAEFVIVSWIYVGVQLWELVLIS